MARFEKTLGELRSAFFRARKNELEANISTVIEATGKTPDQLWEEFERFAAERFEHSIALSLDGTKGLPADLVVVIEDTPPDNQSTRPWWARLWKWFLVELGVETVPGFRPPVRVRGSVSPDTFAVDKILLSDCCPQITSTERGFDPNFLALAMAGQGVDQFLVLKGTQRIFFTHDNYCPELQF